MGVDVVLTASDDLPNGYLFADTVEAEGFVGRRIVRQSDGAACLALVVPVRVAPATASAERIDAAIAARKERDFKVRIAMAAIRSPDEIPQIAAKHGLYAVQIIQWKHELLKGIDPPLGAMP